METASLITYYTDLLIRQYHDKPLARGAVSSIISETVADQIIRQAMDAFDLETAVGAQLDVLGTYRGIGRNIVGLEMFKTYLAMPAYDDANPGQYAGLYSYGDTAISTNMIQYADMHRSLFTLSDYDMRRLIKLRIRLHMSDCSLSDIDDIVWTFFGADCTVTDGADMSITYAFDPDITDLLPRLAVYTGSLPKPAGVAVVVTGVTI